MNHERRNAEDKARSSKRDRDRDAYLDARTDRYLQAAPRCPAGHWQPGLGPCVCEGRVHKAAAHGTTLEEAVDALRRTLGK